MNGGPRFRSLLQSKTRASARGYDEGQAIVIQRKKEFAVTRTLQE